MREGPVGGTVLRQALAATVCCLFLTPLVVSPWTLFPFMAGKAFAARVLVELATLLYVWLMLVDHAARPRIGRLGVAVLVYLAVAVISTLAGINPYRSLWGNLERMEGLVGLLHGVALFVVVGSAFRTRAAWVRFFEFSLAASSLVALFAAIEAHRAAGVPVHRPGSTLGHPDFLATYALFQVFFAASSWRVEAAGWRRWTAAGLGVLNVVVLALTASRGAWLGLYAALIAGAVLHAIVAPPRTRTRAAAAAVAVALLAAPIAIRAMQGTALVSTMPHVVQRLAATSLAEPSAQTRLRSLRTSLRRDQGPAALRLGSR